MNESKSVSVPTAAWLVAKREISAQSRSKSFIFSYLFLLVLAIAGVLVSGWLSAKEPSNTPIAVVSGTAQYTSGIPYLEVTEADSEDAARALVSDGEVDAALVPDSGVLGFKIVADESAPTELVAAFSVSPVVELLDPDAASFLMRYMVPYIFGIVFMMMTMTFGSTIAQNTIVEKQTRTVELLLAAVPARALLAGKTLGNSILAFGEVASIAAVTIIAMIATGQNSLLDMLGAPLVWFAIFFVFGFLLCASIFAAGGSLVSRIEDSGSVLMPGMMISMAPFMIVAIGSSSKLLVSICSYIPFTAAVAMPTRLFFGEAEWWEAIVSLALLVITTGLVTLLGERIYTASLLKTGSRIKVKDALAKADV